MVTGTADVLRRRYAKKPKRRGSDSSSSHKNSRSSDSSDSSDDDGGGDDDDDDWQPEEDEHVEARDGSSDDEWRVRPTAPSATVAVEPEWQCCACPWVRTSDCKYARLLYITSWLCVSPVVVALACTHSPGHCHALSCALQAATVRSVNSDGTFKVRYEDGSSGVSEHVLIATYF
jgi:hypothetical protein